MASTNRAKASPFVFAALLVGAAWWLPPGIAVAEGLPVKIETRTRSGNAYEGDQLSGSKMPEPIFSVRLERETAPGVDRLRVTHVDPTGRTFYTQTVDFDDGDSPKTYTFSNTASKEEGKLTVTSTELLMEYTEGGKTKTAREPRPAVFAVGPSISRIVEKRIADLVAGKSVAFRMVAVNKLQVFALRVAKEPPDADETIAEVKSGAWLRLRIEPESALARFFAPKILTLVDAKTGETLSVCGPLPSPAPGVGILKTGTIHYERLR